MQLLKVFLVGVVAAAVGDASAHAADMAPKGPYVKAPMLKAAPVYNWTGFYLGVNGGLGASQTSASTPNAANNSGGNTGPGSIDSSDVGFAGGLQAGFNWQFAPQWVAGIEGDLGFLGINRSSLDWDDTQAFGIKTNWYGTLRGRLGYTNGLSLFYVTGGAAFVNIKNNFDDLATSVLASKSETAAGWTVGGGIETLLGGNWSAKAEYLYIDAGTQEVSNVVSGINGLVPTAPFDNRFHLYRYGLNYKFGPAVAVNTLPQHHWTGFYIGANIGTGLSQSKATATTNPLNVGSGSDVGIAAAGVTGGMQLGYNWQFASKWIIGFEGDVQYFGIKRSPINWDDPDIVFGLKANWLSTLRGRLGYSTGPALLYVTGGAAFVKDTNNFDSLNTPVSFASKSETASGWTVGGGIESALSQNWTAKTEYLYVDAGSQDVFNPNIGSGIGAATAHFDNRFHVFRFGLNYAFGGY